MICLDQARVGNWVTERVGGVWTGVHEAAVGWESGGELVAGCMFEKYVLRRSIVAHLAVERLARGFVLAVFRYGFVQCQIRTAIAIVDSDNEKALALNKRLGFVEQCRLANAAKNGDLVIMTFDTSAYTALEERYGR